MVTEIDCQVDPSAIRVTMDRMEDLFPNDPPDTVMLYVAQELGIEVEDVRRALGRDNGE